MPTVSVLKTERYDEALLDRAIARHFEALHVQDDLKPGMKVLIKPNLLTGRDPSMAVTTHPALLRAIAKWLRAHGIEHITLADSPGGLYTPAALRKVYAACKLTQLSDVLTLNEDCTHGEKNGFSILTPVLEADYIINCAKLKTHALTVMSAGVKNLFGCIPGLQKPEWHARRSTLDGFCGMLIDLCETVKPDLTIIDAIDCMEGNGPGGGTVRFMGCTLCSRSPYAVDEAGARLMALPDRMAPIIQAARKRSLPGEAITYTGDELIPASPAFTLADAVMGKERTLSINGLFHRFCGRKRSYPKLIPDRCVGCGKCAESCPVHLIDIVDRKAVIRRKGCISCFCCQEMCPAHAIQATKGR